MTKQTVKIEGKLYKLTKSDSVADCNLRDNIGCKNCYISCTPLDRNGNFFNFVLKEIKDGNSNL